MHTTPHLVSFLSKRGFRFSWKPEYKLNIWDKCCLGNKKTPKITLQFVCTLCRRGDERARVYTRLSTAALLRQDGIYRSARQQHHQTQEIHTTKICRWAFGLSGTGWGNCESSINCLNWIPCTIVLIFLWWWCDHRLGSWCGRVVVYTTVGTSSGQTV